MGASKQATRTRVVVVPGLRRGDYRTVTWVCSAAECRCRCSLYAGVVGGGGGVWGGILEGEGVYHTLTYLLGVTCGFRFVEGNV